MTAPVKKSTVLKIDCLPFGFFERELLQYFSQFGDVRRVRVPRNKKTGNFKGWAYIMFADETVAQVAMEAMDGYLMFEKRLKCRILDEEKVPSFMKTGARMVAQPHKGLTTRKHSKKLHKTKTEEEDEKANIRRTKAMNKRMKKLSAMGVDYSMDVKKDEEDKNEVMIIQDNDTLLTVEESGKKKKVNEMKKTIEKTPIEKKKKNDKAATPKTPLSARTPPLKSRLRSAKKN